MSAEQTLEQGKVQTDDNAAQNEYIVIINKRIRALKKKVQNIGYIEKRVANKEEINNDQKQVLASKDNTLKSLAEIETIRNQFLAYYNQKESKDKKPAPQTENKIPAGEETKVLLRLLHIARLYDLNLHGGLEARHAFFAEQAKAGKAVVQSDAEIDALFPLCSVVFNSPPNQIDTATAVSQKFFDEADEEFVPGITFKHLKAVYNELISSSFFKGVPLEMEPQQYAPEPVKQEVATIQQEVNQQEATPQEAPQELEQQQPASDQQEQQEEAQEGEVPAEQSQDAQQPRDGTRGRGRGRGRGGRGRGRGNYRGGQDNRDNRERGNYEHRERGNYENRDRGTYENRERNFDNRGSGEFKRVGGGNRGGRGGERRGRGQGQQDQGQSGQRA